MLALVEEILILALDDDLGKLSSFSAPYMHIAIAGAIISELTIQKKIKIVNKDKKKYTI